jgi:CDP-diacylglycerol--serine O-phosphatidyltransferase
VEGKEQLDGRRARLSGGSCEYTLDSTRLKITIAANTPHQISFGVAPSIAAFAAGMRTPLDQLLLTCFVLSGLARLARFNVTTGNVPKDANGKAKYFEGLPIPTSLSIMGLMAFWVSKGWIQGNIPYGTFLTGTLLEFHPTVLLFLAHGCCMLSKTLHVPKP